MQENNAYPHRDQSIRKELKKLFEELLKNDRELKRELKKILPPSQLLDGWFPASHVKEMLGISSSTLHRFMTEGTLPYSKLGNRTMFNKDDIVELLKENYRRH